MGFFLPCRCCIDEEGWMSSQITNWALGGVLRKGGCMKKGEKVESESVIFCVAQLFILQLLEGYF